jgi:hypothetical protein
MYDKPTDTLGSPNLQEFSDKAITDPAELARLNSQLRRPRKGSPWFWRLLLAAAVSGALAAGFLLGKVIF